jgi:GxxExxY protein
LPVEYKGVLADCGYRIDLLVNDLVILELKCCSEVSEVHKAQLLTYLKLSGESVGLLLNFHAALMKHGITRMVL